MIRVSFSLFLSFSVFCYFTLLLIFMKIILLFLLLLLFFFFFHENYFYFFMFRDVPECSVFLVLSTLFDLAAFQLSTIAPVKKSVNHPRTVASMRVTSWE